MATKKPTKKITKKSAAKKAVKKAAPKKKAPAKKVTKKPVKKVVKTAVPKAPKPIGRVTHYFDNVKVAVINLQKGNKLKVGDSIRIEGGEVDFVQPIKSIQIDHEEVKSVKAGDDFGLKVKKLVREGYRVHKA